MNKEKNIKVIKFITFYKFLITEIRHFYNSNRDNYEYRTISHIYISNLKRTDAEAVKLAAEVSQKAKSGQDFYQLKGTYCEELTDKNDYMYEFKRGTREKLFEDIVFSLSVNQVSNPIKTSYGYYIVKVLEKNYYSYDSVKEQIKKELNFSKNYSVMLQTIEQWFKEAEIKININ
ncbi:peptidylprolyl isomerase [Petroclostridium xylanilyticum]|uniref:peptidylprolyl isomerase n=1 Tax=Petroclostridium xylanilyticum TaxID=1792311 RepID=UPI0012FFC332|nr:peptidylprolyl isomerase [Petroclostridium xylanilyticum]